MVKEEGDVRKFTGPMALHQAKLKRNVEKLPGHSAPTKDACRNLT